MNNLQIPNIELNKLAVTKNDECVNLFYGINDSALSNEAIKVINKESDKYNGTPYFPFDFKNETKFENKTWGIEGDFNIFENTASTIETSLIQYNDSGYDKIFWKCIKLTNLKS